MVTRAYFGALADACGVHILPDLDVIVTDGESLLGLIHLAESESLVVLGMDGLDLEETRVVPSGNHIADFSDISGDWESRVRRSAAAARNVAQCWSPMPDLIEVTFDGLDS